MKKIIFILSLLLISIFILTLAGSVMAYTPQEECAQCGGNWGRHCGRSQDDCKCPGDTCGGSSSSNPPSHSSQSTNPPPIVYPPPIIPPPEEAATAAHVTQTVTLPAGSYTFSVKAQAPVSKGGGVFVDIMCTLANCGNGIGQNGVMALVLVSETPTLATYSVPMGITVAGAYRVNVVVEQGSEASFDSVSINGGGTEYVTNSDFTSVKSTPQNILLDEPDSWGEGDNKVGYYYGRAFNASSSNSNSPNSSSSNSSATGSAAVKLNLKLKLQGVTAKPKVADSIKVKVKLGGGGLSAATDYQTVDFNVGSDGVWSGTAGFNVPPGGHYKVYIKGPKHLQKKVCDSAPAESAGGTYHCGDGNIPIAAGDNTLDFSKILFLVGDLPQDGAQNGVIDAYDTTFVRQHMQSTTAADLAIGDLNYDGVIDSQDFSLILASLSIKYDEE